MATHKKRINISISRELETLLERLAKRDQMPQATKAEHLLQLALEFEEDEALDAIATQRDQKKSKYVSHASAWR